MLIIILFSAVSFFYFGFSCLMSRQMVVEFDRYRLRRYRGAVGALQLAGAVGLLIGLNVPVVGFLASSGLAAMMLLGLVVRLKIRDGFIRSSPALFYFLLNMGLSIACLVR